MAKKGVGSSVKKVSFGSRRKGKARKNSGPKDKPVSKYRGQGR